MPSDYRPNVPDEALDKFDKEKEKEEETPKVAKKPIEKWLDAIKEVGLSDIEAENILDEYLQKGFWEKDYNLFRGKLKVTLRTREGYSLQRVANSLDALRTNDPTVYTQTMFRINLASSLSKFKEIRFDFPKYNGKNATEIDEQFTKRLQFIDTEIGSLILQQLYFALENFDQLTRAVFSEGAASGF